jgi:hypothetical protein
MKYISFKVFGYDILMYLVVKATFHISSIRHCVVMINMSDIRSRKAGNGLETAKKMCARLVFPFGNSRQKKAAVSLFLETAVMNPKTATRSPLANSASSRVLDPPWLHG